MPSFVRRAVRVFVLFAVVAYGVSYSRAQACDRPHYARPMPRPVQSRIPDSATPSSAATKAYVDPETGRLSENPAPTVTESEPEEPAALEPDLSARPAQTQPAPSGGVKAKFGRERFPH